MEKSLELYTEIGNDLTKRKKSVALSKMFGMPTLKAEGKAFAGLFKDEMVFKLSGEEHSKAITLKGARLFDPSGMNRPMKEWVQIPFKFSAQWKVFAEAAHSYVTEVNKKKATPEKSASKGKK